MLNASSVLAGLPSGLRAELLAAYDAIARNFIEHRWEPAELNGGKFCEVAFCIVDGAVSGTMPARASKPANFVTACRNLEGKAANAALVGDRSFRVLIPRTLLGMYEIRNNRNVGHVGGDVDPNFMDAMAVYGLASWVLAELVRIFHGTPTSEAQETVDALVERKHPLVWEVEGVRRVLDPSLNFSDQSLLLLYAKTSWTSVAELIAWVEYSNASKYRTELLVKLHKMRLVEFDRLKDRVRISPLGIHDVETRILGTIG